MKRPTTERRKEELRDKKRESSQIKSNALMSMGV
jgi:hypothetical protein